MSPHSGGSASPAPAVLRAAAILELIAAHPDNPPRITDLAVDLGLPKSSTTNIVTALVEAGLARRNGSTYTLGPTLVDLASAFLKDEDPILRFRQFVPALPTASQETVQLGTLSGADVVYLARHEGNQTITMTSSVGKRLPASSTALGKAMLANVSDDRVASIVAEPLRPLTLRSHTTIESLLTDLETVRGRGYAVDDEEASPNVVCLAVAVPGQTGDGSYAVSTTLFKDRLDPAFECNLVHDLTQLANYLSPV